MNAAITLLESKLTSAKGQTPSTTDVSARKELFSRIADYEAALAMLRGEPAPVPLGGDPEPAEPVDPPTSPGTQAHVRKLMGETPRGPKKAVPKQTKDT